MSTSSESAVGPISRRLSSAIARVCATLGDGDVSLVPTRLDDAALLRALDDVGQARRSLDLVTASLTAEVERRSARDLGHTGLAQKTGHRTGTDLIQHVTGQTRADIRKAAAAGRDLASVAPIAAKMNETDAAAPTPWFAPLTAAHTEGALSREQFDAIRRGLGEPPVERYPSLGDDAVRAMWREAAVVLVCEAAEQGVEDLAGAARLARDTLDPIGTELRFEERFARRSFAVFTDENGQLGARIRFDDDAAAWVRTILNAALRPRRGPRFVDSEAHAGAGGDPGDARTTEQLQYDTLLAILRTGAAADPAQAFGDRQPGVRIISPVEGLQGRDASGTPVTVAVYEETATALPVGVLETYLCNAATVPVTVDSCGNPLDVGREKRLFTPKQRLALAVRDGGCLWCGAEPSRCEAHHIDHWYEHHGRTDVRDGVLLCRNCHMRLHNGRWRIVRDGTEYWLHPPPGSAESKRRMRPRSLLRFARAG